MSEEEFSCVYDRAPVLIDNGSGMMKVGWIGDDAPVNIILSVFLKVVLWNNYSFRSVFPTLIGRLKKGHGGINFRYESRHDVKEIYIGDHAQCKRSILNLSNPLPNDGSQVDWESLEKIWHHSFYLEARCYPEDNPIMMTNLHQMDDNTFEKMSEIMFENYQAIYFSIVDSALCSLMATGRVIGTVLEIGDGMTKALSNFGSVDQTLPISYSQIKMENPTKIEKRLSGSRITDYLVNLLAQKGIFENPTSTELEIIRDIKERLCYVALDFNKELKKSKDSLNHEYELPDGTKMELNTELFEAPEILFQPSIIGYEVPSASDIVQQSIQKCNPELQERLYNNIVLSGGSTMFKGMAERLEYEITSSRKKKNDFVVKVRSPQERKFSAWIGGSVLGSLSSFDSEWVSKRSYEENGKCRIFMKHHSQTVVCEYKESYLRYLLMKNSEEIDLDEKERLFFCFNNDLVVDERLRKRIVCSNVEIECCELLFFLNFVK